MNATEEFAYRSAATATKIVERASSEMKQHEIAAELGVSESTVRSWKANPGAAINAKTARKLRRLERRIGR